MSDVPDSDLLRQFVQFQSEAAFAALVQRHLGLVYSVAVRHTANLQLAEDIAQAVFIILARKAESLGPRVVLAGWLYHTARLTAANFQRTEARRLRREQEAFMQSLDDEPANDALWRELSPLLDDAMAGLRPSDRDALVLRFFQNRSLGEVGSALGVAERAAQKRVDRALEKLRKFFTGRGVVSTTAIIAGAISSNSVQAAPAALANSVTAVALAKGAAAGASTLTLVKGALKVMAWTKMQTAIVAGIVVLLAAGATTITVKEIQRHTDDRWDIGQLDGSILRTAPHIVRIIPSRFLNQGGWTSIANGSILGFGNSVGNLLQAAYGGGDYFPPARTIFLTKLPPGKYDFIANLPSGSQAAFRREIEKKFGIVAQRETVATNVLFLQVRFSNAPGIRPTAASNYHGPNGGKQGDFHYTNAPMAYIAEMAEAFLGVPVVDATGLTGHYDMDLKWDYQNDPRHEKLKEALSNQLGLELVPTNMPVEMLVVEKAD